MSSLLLAYKTITKKASAISIPMIPWKTVSILAGAAAVALLVLYVYWVMQLTQGAFLIKNYNKELGVLSQENRALEADFAKANIGDTIVQRAHELSFQRSTDIKYLQIIEQAVAKAP